MLNHIEKQQILL